MSVRKSIIRSYLQEEEIYEIVGHDILVFMKIATIYLVFLLSLGVIRYLLRFHLDAYSRYRGSWIVTVMGSVIYLKGTLDILDSYLDALLITNVGLIIFKWDGLFKQRATNIQRVSVETVMYEQNSFWDTIFKKGDLKISVEDVQYTFKEVSTPSEKVTRIITWKEKILGRFHYSENESEPINKDKYELLVEALGEVVTEYVDKKNGRTQY